MSDTTTVTTNPQAGTDVTPQAGTPNPQAGAGTGTNSNTNTEQKPNIDDLINQLKEANREAASYRTKLKSLENKEAEAEEERKKRNGEFEALANQHKSRAEELEKQLADRDLAELKRKIATKHNLTEALSNRLFGTTEEELDKDAKELAKLVPASTVGKSGNVANGKASGSAGVPSEEEIYKRLNASGRYN
jgi:chromosome segregation ATPase